MKPYDGSIPEAGELNAAYECALVYQRRFESIAQLAVIKSSDDIVRLLRPIWPGDIEYRETFIVVMLDTSNHVIGYHTVSTCGMANCVVDVRMIAQHALMAKATGVILAHNHPSGGTRPSQCDIDITRNVQAGLKQLDIKVLDHVVITSESFYSFADSGLL